MDTIVIRSTKETTRKLVAGYRAYRAKCSKPLDFTDWMLSVALDGALSDQLNYRDTLKLPRVKG